MLSLLSKNKITDPVNVDCPRSEGKISSLVLFPAKQTKELKSSVKELSNDIQFVVVELKKLVGMVGSKLLLAE